MLALAAVVFSGLHDTPHLWAAVLALAVLLAIHLLYLLGALAGFRGGWWTIAVAAWLTYLPLALLGPAWTPLCAPLTGSLLLAAARIRSPVLVAAALACGPVLLLAPRPALVQQEWAIASPVAGLVEYALVVLASRAHRLAVARTDLIHRAVAQERRRFTRDLHDLVGHRLTVLVLKAELIQRLVETGDGKAVGEVGETLELVRDLAGDVRAVAHGGTRFSLEDELAAARALLESVGVRCRINVSCRDLSGGIAQALTFVLREAISNVLRHAAARECAIRLVERGELVELSVWNDGVRPSRAHEGGIGLANLTERVTELGGWATVGDSRNGQFAFTVHLPR